MPAVPSPTWANDVLQDCCRGTRVLPVGEHTQPAIPAMLGRVLGGVFSGSAPVVRNWGAAGARRGAVSRGQCVQQSVAAARARWGESRATVASCRGLATYSDDFLRDIPKSDLHVHLDGSVRVDTVCELAAEAGIELPGGATTPEELREAVYKPEFASLEEYLETFATTNLVAQTPAQMERSECDAHPAPCRCRSASRRCFPFTALQSQVCSH